MGIADDAVEVRAQGWRTLAALHGLIEAELERALAASVELSVVEYTVLDALSRQDGWHMRMQQLARAAALSPSATTRLVNRLEDRALLTRVLCADDRRGIYTELTAVGPRALRAGATDPRRDARARTRRGRAAARARARRRGAARAWRCRSPPAEGLDRRCAPLDRLPPAARRQPAGRSGLGAADVHEPGDAVAVDAHAERVAPGRDLERHGDRAAARELVPVARGASRRRRGRPRVRPRCCRVPVYSLWLGVSAPISVMPPDSSWLCMILFASAGSSAAPNSAKVLDVSSPPKTDW